MNLAEVETEHPIKLSPRVLADRDAFLLDLVRDSKVIHLGCVDSGFTASKYAKGELLHQKLGDVCSDLWGIDIDQESLEFLQEKGIERLICADICKDVVNVESEIDYVVAGEVLEHLSNPGLFLDGVAKLCKQYDTKFIASVPNAFAWFRQPKLLRGIEHVHEDHVAYFSPKTLAELLGRSSFEIKDQFGYIRVNPHSRFKARLKSGLFNLLPGRLSVFADGLIVVAQLASEGD